MICLYLLLLSLTHSSSQVGKKFKSKEMAAPYFSNYLEMDILTQFAIDQYNKTEDSDWSAVQVNDYVIVNAAEVAVDTIQERTNSVVPYELHEIVDARASVGCEGSLMLELLVVLKRGEEREVFKVYVSNHAIRFKLNQMEPNLL